MSDQNAFVAEPVDSPLSLNQVIRTLRGYLPMIVLTVSAVGLSYVILAGGYYLVAPAQRVTSLPFRIEFQGAERGTYPNGVKFSSNEIVSAPILTKTFRQSDLSRFTSLQEFSNSVFVLESNASQEFLAQEYQARLSDPRLTSVDRERIQREYELKLGSLSKNEFSLNYLRSRRGEVLPEVVARKVLQDILRNWTEYVSKEQHVLEYQVSVLSPDVVAGPSEPGTNPIISTIILRGKILRLLENISRIRQLPNAELARTDKDGLSLNDIAVRLDDLIRFSLDPLIASSVGAGFDNRNETIAFLNTQLSHDQRELDAQVRVADAAQRTLALYMNTQQAPPEDSTGSVGGVARGRATTAEGNTVMPQINDTFIDRLIQLTASSADVEFRKKLAEDYGRASIAIVPLEQAVAYDRSVLELLRGSGESATPTTREAVAHQIAATRNEVRQLALKVAEVHEAVSRNLNPSTELLSVQAPYTRIDRAVSVKKLLLLGILLCAAALVVSVVAALFHARMREEDASGSSRSA